MTKYFDIDKEEPPTRHRICRGIAYKNLAKTGLNLFMSIIIMLVNDLVRFLTLFLITWIGHRTFSRLYSVIFNWVFVSLFYNTGLFLIVVNAKADAFGTKLDILGGLYNDFSRDWIKDIGFIYV